jgi:hypothetical protein
MNGIDWGHVISIAQLALQFLLIPIVQKVWSLDTRMVRVETLIEKEN